MGVGIFSDCVFFFKVNTLPFKERSHLKKSITSNGGAISLVLNEKCTHVVVVSISVLNNSHQKKIQKHCIQVVKPDFIWKSIQENRLVESAFTDDTRISDVTKDEVRDKDLRFLDKWTWQTKTDISEEDLKDDETEEEEEEKDLPSDTEVAKYSFFQKGQEVAIVEILCFNEQHPYPYKISTVCTILGSFQKEIGFNLTHSAEKACDKYEQRIKDLKNKGFTQIDKIPPEAEYFASQALKKVLLGEALNVAQLCPEVGGFVESIWTQAQGHLFSVLSCPVAKISLNDVSKAEGILQLVRSALQKKKSDVNIRQMMQEFYQCIPHNDQMLVNIDKRFLTAKQDLCQLIRDMLNVCETNSSRSYPSSVAKYRALRCRIEYVDPNTEEFQRVRQEVLDNNHSNEEFQVISVFRIGRLSEAINFKSDLGNIKSLLHATSPRNFVGILSRGLQLPKMITDEFGMERTDIGNLGSGIYFSDSISTSVKYTEACSVSGVRLLLVCDVALGKTKDVTKRNFTITEAPEGFHSIHGVRNNVGNSDFTDDEYVVYSVNQVKMSYVVQFCTKADTPNLQHGPSLTMEVENNDQKTYEPTEDVPAEDLPEDELIKGGLQAMDGQQIPLENIHVKARLMDLAAQVIIFQTYKNNSLSPIEAKYVFPLDSTAAVCGFEAFINGKHIVGEVKEKQQAHREYRTAISEGHGAYLMDQGAHDVFTVSVGNLPAKATVIIKITYVTELECLYSSITFNIPGAVASWQEDQALKENTQDAVAKVGIDGDTAAEASFCLDISIEMPRKINFIWCHTHDLKIKRTECKAVIKVKDGSSLTDRGFNLDISLEDVHMPRMWVETHPEQTSEACMLIFKPQFEDCYETANMTICLDCSNSMESCFTSAKRVALLALSSLSYNSINIIIFGSTYKEFYFYPRNQPNDIPEMEKFIKAAKPNMGNTEFWKPLQSICLLRPSSGQQKVLLISDGHFQNDHFVFQILKKHENNIKLFTCGVGSTANKHMLRSLAKLGCGAFEYFADKSKSTWRSQMGKQYARLQSPACTDISVKWRLFEGDTAPVQAPANIQSLFENDNLFVYGFVSYCTQATLKALIANKEFENMISTTELQKTKGTILHKLTARALIRDYEDGILSEKEHENEMEKLKRKSFIINLSKEHSIVTQFTSFVAIEKRSEGESENIEPDVAAIISAEQVDILPYMEYTDLQDDQMGFMACDSLQEDGGMEIVACESLQDDDMGILACDPLQEPLPETIVTEKTSEWQEETKSKKKRRKRRAGKSYTTEETKELEADFPLELQFLEDTPSLTLICEETVTSQVRHSAKGIGMLCTENLPPRVSDRVEPPDLRLAQLSSPPVSPAYAPVSPANDSTLSSFGSAAKVFGSATTFGSASTFDSAAQPYFVSASSPFHSSSALFGSALGMSNSAAPSVGPSLQSCSASIMPKPFLPTVNLGMNLGMEKAQSQMFQSSPVYHSAGRIGMLGSQNLPPQVSDRVEPPELRLAQLSLPPVSPAYAPVSPAYVSTSSSFGSAAEVFGSAATTFGSTSTFGSAAPTYLSESSPFHSSSTLFGSASRMSNLAAPFVRPLSKRRTRGHSGSTMQVQHGMPLLSGTKTSLADTWQPQPLLAGAPPPPPPPPPPSGAGLPPTLLGGGVPPPPRGACAPSPYALYASFPPSPLFKPSWSSLSPLQSQEGYWMLTPQLGRVLQIDVQYLCDEFLAQKGVSSLGSRGKDEILKLIATLLVLQTIRHYNLLNGIKFKTLMKLDQCDSESEHLPSIKKAINWAGKTDRQYPGICSRLGLGRDWDHATRQLLRIGAPLI